jgi:hypothetical protein
MKLRVLAAAGLLALTTGTASLPVIAQTAADDNGVPTYQSWMTDWDNGQYDHSHVILGTVADFKPFRLTVSRPDGPTQTIDLKQGTTILPSGMTPMLNQRVAVVGYYSNGTFVANRVILHQ